VESGQETVLENGLMFGQGLSHWISGLPGDRDAEDSKDEAGGRRGIEGLERSDDFQTSVALSPVQKSRRFVWADIYHGSWGILPFDWRIHCGWSRPCFCFRVLFLACWHLLNFLRPDIAKQCGIPKIYFRSCDGG